MQSLAVHPAFAQNHLELAAEGLPDWFFGGKQVAVRNLLLAFHRGAQRGAHLLEDVGTHVLHDGTHNGDPGEVLRGTALVLKLIHTPPRVFDGVLYRSL